MYAASTYLSHLGSIVLGKHMLYAQIPLQRIWIFHIIRQVARCPCSSCCLFHNRDTRTATRRNAAVVKERSARAGWASARAVERGTDHRWTGRLVTFVIQHGMSVVRDVCEIC